MIELYTGTPGSGKSLHLAKKMRDWMHRWKCPVIANFYFKAEMCRPRGFGGYLYVDNSMLTPDFLIWFSSYYKDKRKLRRVPEETILIVIDECQLLFNARSWNDRNRADWVSFFSQHRKLGYRVILVAQFAEMIDKQIRALIEYEYVHRKVKNIGFGGRVLDLASGGGLHVAVKIYRPLNDKVGTEFFKADRGLFALYDSYTRFGCVEGVAPLGAGTSTQMKRVK